MTSDYPMASISLKIASFKGFGGKPSGFDKFDPINVIIGRNNSGKSALIDAVELAISQGRTFNPLKHSRGSSSYELFVSQKIDEPSLRCAFSDSTSGGGISGNHWSYAQQFLGKSMTRVFKQGWHATIHEDEIFSEIRSSGVNYINNFLHNLTWPLADLVLLRVSAERDVQPEKDDGSREIHPNGTGTTALVQAFINRDDLPRREVEVSLLNDLNKVYQGDSTFTQILVRQDAELNWEIHLREEQKGDIRLSQSGSSLKSIFILLSMMRLVSVIRNIDWRKVVLALEEPENNLHPALLRRLLNFLAERRDELGFTLLLTTHSPVCIDWSARRTDSQVIHVQFRDGSSIARTAIGYTKGRDILDDLDVRASDILQANGIIWVEGPSDRIYVKRWIELWSKGRLKEGVHYATMFYGGKLLAHLNGLPPDESGALISLLRLNRNAALLIDSDRHLGSKATGTKPARKPRLRLNPTKSRLKKELEAVGGLVWITEGREVENYVPASAFARITKQLIPDLGRFDKIPEMNFLADFKGNKVALAHAVAEKLTLTDIKGSLDLDSRLDELCKSIERWNNYDT